MSDEDAMARRPRRATVMLVMGLIGALLVGSAGTAVAAGLITSAQIKNGTIQNVDIRNNTITGKKIRNGTVTGADVKNRSITGSDIKKSSLTGGLVKNGSLTGADVKDGSLTGADVKDGSLTGTDVKDGSLTGADVAEGTLTDAHLAPESRTQWAAVAGNGTLHRGSAGTAASRVSAGIYSVTFPIDIDQCGYSVSIGNLTSGGTTAGVVFLNLPFDNPQGLVIETFSFDAVRSDRPFYVTVNC